MSGKKIDAYNVESINYSHNSTDQVLKHKHENFEIVYYLEGKGLSTVYGETIYNFNYNADSLLIIPPNLYHGEYAKEKTKIVCNQLDLPMEHTEKALFYKKTAKNAPIFAKIKGYMLEINALWFEMHSKKADNAAKINELLLHLSISVFNLISKDKKSKKEYDAEFSGVVKDYIKRYAFKKINYTILAEEFGYSYDRFRHIFIEETGMTLYAYQQGLRFDYAKKMLLLSDMKIHDIALRCGYANSIRFCEWFSNMAGMSPRKYRSMNDNFEWGVILNANDVKRRNKVPVILDVDTDGASAGLSLALAHVMHKRGYIELLCAGLTHAEPTALDNFRNAAFFYGNEQLEVGGGRKECVELFKQKLALCEDFVTMVFTGGLTDLVELLKDETGRRLVLEKVSLIIVPAIVVEAERETEALKISLAELPIAVLDSSAPITIDSSDVIDENRRNPFFAMLKAEENDCNVMDMVALMYAVFGHGGMFTLYENRAFSLSGEKLLVSDGGKGSFLKINTRPELRNQIYAVMLKICNAIKG
ncbi:MAG: AraC family transcriptional regulator [Clostridia bacterium]|nr:AraC family transcriptional regulator [Clostridia bacterium]